MLPVVMPSNLVSMVRKLTVRFPGRLGLLYGLDSEENPYGYPYSLDNGRFPVWRKRTPWDEAAYYALLDFAMENSYPPLWAAVPDVVADPEATIREWGKWVRIIRYFLSCDLAFVVQDGMTRRDVNALHPKPDLIFVGETFQWKRRSLPHWVKHFKRVHVGRVNTGRMLWAVHRLGVESSDGTGWWHRKQQADLVRYLERTSSGRERYDTKGFYY